MTNEITFKCKSVIIKTYSNKNNEEFLALLFISDSLETSPKVSSDEKTKNLLVKSVNNYVILEKVDSDEKTKNLFVTNIVGELNEDNEEQVLAFIGDNSETLTKLDLDEKTQNLFATNIVSEPNEDNEESVFALISNNPKIAELKKDDVKENQKIPISTRSLGRLKITVLKGPITYFLKRKTESGWTTDTQTISSETTETLLPNSHFIFYFTSPLQNAKCQLSW
ncbi:MAG: hypothetical protein SXA11_14850 [Cyanobacteriota bacterium]|nr:hypothetical protein [Cyanobacteriota bacterium]